MFIYQINFTIFLLKLTSHLSNQHRPTVSKSNYAQPTNDALAFAAPMRFAIMAAKSYLLSSLSFRERTTPTPPRDPVIEATVCSLAPVLSTEMRIHDGTNQSRVGTTAS